jgi:hypothetical protein
LCSRPRSGWSGSCQKSAGLRTHTVVGLDSALFLLVSKYGFEDVVVPGQVVFDPFRVRLELRGEDPDTGLVAALNEVDGVVEIGTEQDDDY